MNGNLPNEQRLWMVKLQGLNYSTSSHPLSPSYVIAQNADEAYRKVRAWLDKKDYGFRKDRELDSVTLMADVGEYSDAPARLFL